MANLFSQLGINLPMLVAQAVNFLILLVVLTVFVYRPLLQMMEERRKKIEFGIKGAELAETKMAEAERKYGQRVKEADKEAVKIVSQAEVKAGERKKEIVTEAEEKSETILAEAKITAANRREEELSKLSKEAAILIKEAIIKTTELEPEAVDDKLILQAVESVKLKNKE